MTVDEILKKYNFYTVHDIIDFLKFKEENAVDELYKKIYSEARYAILKNFHDIMMKAESEVSD